MREVAAYALLGGGVALQLMACAGVLLMREALDRVHFAGATSAAALLVRDPLRQLVVAGVFGLALALLFFVFGAPDVALSQIVVSAVVLPLLALLTLARMREREEGE